MLKSINLGVAFLLELCMLVALAYWGLQATTNTLINVVLAVGAAVLAVVIWGRFMAPQSETRLTGTSYIALKFVLFGVSAVLLAVAGQVTLAIIFIVVAIINQVFITVGKMDTEEPAKKKNEESPT